MFNYSDILDCNVVYCRQKNWTICRPESDCWSGSKHFVINMKHIKYQPVTGLDPDQARQYFRTDLDPDRLTLMVFLEKKILKLILKKISIRQKIMKNFSTCRHLLFKALNKSWTLEIAITLKEPISTSGLFCHLPKWFKAFSAFSLSWR